MRQMGEKASTPSIHVGDNSVANIGDNNVAVDASLRRSSQVIQITETESKVLADLTRDLYNLVVRLAGDEKEEGRVLHTEFEKAVRSGDARLFRVSRSVSRLSLRACPKDSPTSTS